MMLTKRIIQIKLIFDMKRRTVVVCFLSLLFTACKAIKPYERVYLDDREMELANTSAKDFDAYVKSIREGAVPAAGSKSSGGCGCN
jgi:predicted phosphatase